MPILAPAVSTGSFPRIIGLSPFFGGNYYQIDDATSGDIVNLIDLMLVVE